MKIKNILTSVAITIMCCNAQAQQTSPYVESGTLIINNSGFKNTSIRTLPVLRPTPMHVTNSPINLTFPSRFAVAKSDVFGGATTWAGANGFLILANSIVTGGIVALVPTGCNAYFELSAPLGMWRLPTQREMMLIAIVKLELLAQGHGFSELTGTYWASTQDSATIGWTHTFSLSLMYPRAKTDLYQVRCVRDL